MARALRIQFAGAFYHVTCRGNERRAVFLDDNDRLQFLKLLKSSLDIYHVSLYAYVLMTNHFHLLVQTHQANLAEFMRRFNICYTGWFNAQHRRCGHLYQGRYQAFLVEADAYLLEVSRYLHLNPVRVTRLRSAPVWQLWRSARDYRWSSLSSYVGGPAAGGLVDQALLLAMSRGRSGYQEYILDGLRTGVRDPFRALRPVSILGREDFVCELRNERKLSGSRREQPSYRRLTEPEADPELVLKVVTEVLGMERDRIVAPQGDGIARGMASELLYRHGGLKQEAIGRLLGSISYSGVSRLRSRLQEKLKTDQEVRHSYELASEKLQSLLSSVKI